jgi:farnesyl-diphosphate farnesyltransferase
MANLEDLLEKTSRTFALSIPVLPEPTRGEVMIAYLLFRIADTFEDAAHWPAERRIEALEEFQDVLIDYSRDRAERLSQKWTRTDPSQHAGYRELIREVPFVLECFFALDSQAVSSVRGHVARSAEGMARFVARSRGSVLRLDDLDDLQRYCYVVAGIVGEMLTDLFLLKREQLASIASGLRRRAAAFGEALQLVNILKDASVDVSEGRRFLPSRVPRSKVFALARRDLQTAVEYTLALQQAGAPRGVVEFCALPAELAWATLEKVEKEGPGSKISRLEVFAIKRRVDQALDRGEPVMESRK